jgi:hypothetical protein
MTIDIQDITMRDIYFITDKDLYDFANTDMKMLQTHISKLFQQQISMKLNCNYLRQSQRHLRWDDHIYHVTATDI